MGDEDGDNQETQTVHLSKVQEELTDTKLESTDTPNDTSKSVRVDPPQPAAKQSTAASKIGNSQDAAANLLKNFFKGGR
ncbi:hypothetical protein AGMMS50229_20560 [Campylobacterota bacterium]|nr:hypothetical protein AGMMS50229_20560 [Campylobacterota bacterium]